MNLAELNSNLDALHLGCCQHDHGQPVNQTTTDADMAVALFNMVKELYASRALPIGNVNAAVANAIASRLLQASSQGYGISFADIDYDTPDGAMIKALQDNIWHFSAAKNYTQLRELSNALIGEDGKLRTYAEFKQAAQLINRKHIDQWLRAEYELAVSGSQMASKWVTFTENAEAMPYLVFDAVLDTQTTVLCRNLNGTTLPVNHPFWNTYYPPNHYGERSTVRQKASGKVTDNIPSIEIPNMFKTNLAKQGLVFPESHPYFIESPASFKNYNSERKQ